MPFEQISPELERIVFPEQDVEVLGTGYAVGEGPLWWREDQSPAFQRGQRRPQVEVVYRRGRDPGPGTDQQRQRPDPGPTGQAGHVRGAGRGG